VIADDAVKARAPKHLLACLTESSLAAMTAPIRHPSIDLLLATEDGGMVKAVYAREKPALGVGARNTPVIVHEIANVSADVEAILSRKIFDNGVRCASEQSIIAVGTVYNIVQKDLVQQGEYI
jgi:acetaldehyde dehydrogenase/alcohol dehydrogenase